MFRVGPPDLLVLIVPVIWLIGIAVFGGVIYAAVRLGVRHGMRDAQRLRDPGPTQGPGR